MADINKQGLFFWLKSLVESGRCPGVTWLDQGEGTFQIPWSNQKSRSWQKEDSSIFLEYAKHTCKYKPGEKIDFPKWKQNLKSAINKNRFIERLRDLDHLSGPKPYRVYKFTSEKNTRKKSDDNIPDLSKNVKIIEELNQYHSAFMTANSAISHELFAPERCTSSSSTYTESESALSPAPTLMSDVNLPLSPDLFRTDVYDQPQGNIPTFVTTLDILSGDEDYKICVDVPELSSDTTRHIPGVNVDSATFQKFNQNMESTKQFMPNNSMQTVENRRGNQVSLVVIPPLAQSHHSALPDALAGSSLYTEPYRISCTESGYFTNDMPSQDLNCSISRETSILSSGGAHSPSLQHPTPVQKDVSSSVEVHFPNVGYHIPVKKNVINSGIYQGNVYLTSPQKICLNTAADPRKNLKHTVPVQQSVLNVRTVHTPSKFQNDLSSTDTVGRNLLSTEARLRNASVFSDISAEDDTTAHSMQPVSLSELDMCVSGGCSSDQPSSMDTCEEIIYTGRLQLTSTHFTNYRECDTSETAQSQNSIPRPVEHIAEDSVMHVEILYGTPHRTVKKVNITSSRSICRLFYGTVNTSVIQNAIKGTQNSLEVELPSVDTLDYADKTKDTIRLILKEMEQGIVISYRDGDIFVERRCLPRVFLSDGVSKSENLPRSTKKRPDIETKAFDFNNTFRKAIELNKKNEGPIPKDHFLLTLCYEIIPNDDSPTRLVPIYVVVRHVQAAQERYNILGASTIAPNPMFSDPNSFDDTVRFFKSIDLKK